MERLETPVDLHDGALQKERLGLFVVSRARDVMIFVSL